MSTHGPLNSPVGRLVVDIGIGFILVAGSIVPNPPPPGGFVFPDDVNLATCAFAVGLAITLAWRRRWPIAVFVVTLGTSAVMMATGRSMYGFAVALAVTVYELARSQQRVVAIGAALISAGTMGVLVFVNAADEQQFLRLAGIVATIGFGAATGDAIQSRRSYVSSLTERVRLAEESREQEALRRVTEERLRIARELHDAAAHQIAVINLQAGAASVAFNDGRSTDTQEALSAIRSSAQRVLGDISSLLNLLRAEGQLESRTPMQGLRDIASLIADFERAGLHVTMASPTELPPLDETVDIVAYKVIQEALTNAHKHGSDNTAHLTVVMGEDTLQISVSNPVAHRTDSPGTGHGIAGIRERIDTVSGEVLVQTPPGLFILNVRIPTERVDST